MNHPLHLEALQLVGHIKKSQNRLVEVLIENERVGLYKKMRQPSLFVYCVKALCLSEACAYELISVARKASRFSFLQQALKNRKISVPKAARIVSVLTKENSEEIVRFASSHTVEETAGKLSSMGFARVKKVSFSAETRKKMKRVAEVTGLKTDEAVAKACDEFLFRHDKLQKAQRAEERKNRNGATNNSPKENKRLKIDDDKHTPKATSPNEDPRDPNQDLKSPTLESRVAHQDRRNPTLESRVEPNRTSRKPIPAAVSHAVYLRDQGQCTIHDHHGRRCPNRAFLETHHVVQVQIGGGNEVENLTLVCWQHHDMIHQIQLPMAAAVDWQEIIKRNSISSQDRQRATTPN